MEQPSAPSRATTAGTRALVRTPTAAQTIRQRDLGPSATSPTRYWKIWSMTSASH